jgi:hypothetical protein
LSDGQRLSTSPNGRQHRSQGNACERPKVT